MSEDQPQMTATGSPRHSVNVLVPIDDQMWVVGYNKRLLLRLSFHYSLGFGIYIILYLGVLYFSTGFLDGGATTSIVAMLYPFLTALTISLLSVCIVVRYHRRSLVSTERPNYRAPESPRLRSWTGTGPIEMNESGPPSNGGSRDRPLHSGDVGPLTGTPPLPHEKNL
jgi:hypothetical protein